jgi:hypothetical protein
MRRVRRRRLSTSLASSWAVPVPEVVVSSQLKDQLKPHQHQAHGVTRQHKKYNYLKFNKIFYFSKGEKKAAGEGNHSQENSKEASYPWEESPREGRQGDRKHAMRGSRGKGHSRMVQRSNLKISAQEVIGELKGWRARPIRDQEQGRQMQEIGRARGGGTRGGPAAKKEGGSSALAGASEQMLRTVQA